MKTRNTAAAVVATCIAIGVITVLSFRPSSGCGRPAEVHGPERPANAGLTNQDYIDYCVSNGYPKSECEYIYNGQRRAKGESYHATTK